MAISWILIVILAYFTWSATTLIDKVILVRHLKKPLSISIIIGLNGLFAFLLMPFTGLSFLEPKYMALAIFSGITYVGFLIPLMTGLKEEEATRTMVIAQLTPIFVLTFAFLTINERLSASHLTGFALLLLAGLIVSMKDSKGFSLSRAFWLVLLANAITAMSLVSAKAVYQATKFTDGFIWIRLSAVSTAVLLLLLPQYREDVVSSIRKMSTRFKALVGARLAADFAALLALGYVLIKAPVSIVNAIGQPLFPIGVFLISLLLLKIYPKAIFEEFNRKAIMVKGIALLLVLAGIALVSM